MEKKLSEEQLKEYHDLLIKRSEIKSNMANTYMIIEHQKELMKHMMHKAIEMDNKIDELNNKYTDEFGPISQIDLGTGVITNNEKA